MKKTFADMIKEEAAALRRRMDAKLPQWAGVEGLEYPTRLCTEQCSSGTTAQYKASVLAELLGVGRPSRLDGDWQSAGCQEAAAESSAYRSVTEEGGPVGRPLVADLTGGLGVDSWAFCSAGMDVWYNEMNPELSAAAGRNFSRLGSAGISVHSIEVTPDNIAPLLEEARPSAVYMDPARRSVTGCKVFRIADCTPNVLGMKDAIMERIGLLMLKLSPMADISQVVRELDGPSGRVSEIHIVGASGECKELLLVMRCDAAQSEVVIKVASGESVFEFRPSEEAQSAPHFASAVEQGMILFEPGSALAKSGAFNLVSVRYCLTKADVSTHLYFSDGISASIPDDLAGLGKCFYVREVLPFNNASSRELSSRRLLAEVSARGLQLSSDALRQRLGIKASSPDGRLHIFGLTTRSCGNLLLLTERVS